jgi:DnaJ-class molecular chaperone
MPTHYETLGISKDANETEVKKAYRALSFKHHPDRDSSDTANQKMQEINTAYEVLKDESTRKEYDDELDGVRRGPPGFPPGFHHGFAHGGPDLGSIFEMFFNGGGPNIEIIHGGPNMFFQRHISKPPIINKTVEVNIKDAYNGITMPVEIQKTTQRGDLQITEMETMYLNIPKGINDGEAIILGECGNTINGNIRGDIRIIIQIKNDSCFIRNGLDLVFKKKLTLKEALCGFNFQIEHLNGKTLGINNTTTIIPPGSKKVINTMGMLKEGQPPGNLIIEFEIEFPSTLSPEQKSGIGALLV